MDPIRRSLLGQLAKLTAGAALVPLSSVAQAGINEQPPRRGGNPEKRYGMLIDLRRCIGCQACTVSCHIENAAPLGNFRTVVSQFEVEHEDTGELATFMAQAVQSLRESALRAGLPGTGHLPARRRHRGGRQRSLRGLCLLRQRLPL